MNKDKSVFYSKLWNLMIPIVLQNLILDLVKFSVVQHFVPGQRIVDVLILGTAVNNSKML